MDRLRKNYENLIDLTNQGVWILDGEAVTTFVNRRMARMLGYEPEQMLQRSIFDFMAPHAAEALRRLFTGEVRAEPEQYDLRFEHRHGHEVWTLVETNALRGPAGEFQGALAMVTDISSRKRMESTHRQLATLIQNSSDFIALASVEGRLIFVNAAGLRMVNLSAARAHDLHIRDLVPPGRWHPETEEILMCALDGQRWRGEFQMRRAGDSTLVDVEMSVFGLFDPEEGMPTSLAIVSRDIGARRRGERARAASERKFRLLFDANPLPVVVHELASGRIRAVNAAARSCYGYTDAQFHELSLYNLENPPTGTAHRAELPSTTHYRRDGSSFEVEVTSHALKWDEDEAEIVVVNDVTQRREAERALQQVQEQLQLALQSGGVGLWSYDLVTGAVFYSAEWKRQLGYEDHEVRDELTTWETLVHPDDLNRSRRRMQRYLRQPSSSFEAVSRVQHRDGSHRYMLAQASLVRDDQGQPQRLLGSQVDITERKLAEEQMRLSREQMRALTARTEERIEDERSEIAREVHDQLGQALTALRMDLGALRLRSTQPQQPLEAPEIRSRIERMTDLIDCTIETTRKISRQLRPSVLDDLGLEVALDCLGAEFQTRTQITVELVHAEQPITLTRDRATAAYRVAQEALTNVARHAGATHVEMVLREADQIFVLTIRDNGAGTSADRLAGTSSLGVLGMHERARQAGGELDITSVPGSVPGSGVELILRFPLPAGQGPAKPPGFVTL